MPALCCPPRRGPGSRPGRSGALLPCGASPLLAAGFEGVTGGEALCNGALGSWSGSSPSYPALLHGSRPQALFAWPGLLSEAEQAAGAVAVGPAGRQRGGPGAGDWHPSAGLLPAWEACWEASGAWEGPALFGPCSGPPEAAGIPRAPLVVQGNVLVCFMAVISLL